MTAPVSPTPPEPVFGEGEMLWCMHVLGPDEVYPAPDRATAQIWAAQFTAWWQHKHPQPGKFDPVMSWVVAEWPHDAASHAARLEESIRDNTFPVDPLSTSAAETAALEARVRELEEGLRPFADLIAGSKATAPRHFVQILVCPEGDDDPQDWRPALTKARSLTKERHHD